MFMLVCPPPAQAPGPELPAEQLVAGSCGALYDLPSLEDMETGYLAGKLPQWGGGPFSLFAQDGPERRPTACSSPVAHFTRRMRPPVASTSCGYSGQSEAWSLPLLCCIGATRPPRLSTGSAIMCTCPGILRAFVLQEWCGRKVASCSDHLGKFGRVMNWRQRMNPASKRSPRVPAEGIGGEAVAVVAEGLRVGGWRCLRQIQHV